MELEARWSRTLVVISVLSTALLVGLPVWLWERQGLGAFSPLLLGLMALAPISALFTVRGYRLDGSRLLVRRLLWENEIDLSGLVSVTARPDLGRRTLRLFGNGGLYSFSGLFWNREIGRFRAWVTDWRHAVVLELPRRKVVVSPSDPARLTAALAPLAA